MRKVVSVPVANVWTSNESPRKADLKIIQDPMSIADWVENLTIEEKVELCEHNLLQSQVLYGATVQILEENDNWCHVVIPSQKTAKNKLGYPGWIPKNQLKEPDSNLNKCTNIYVVVRKPTAFLFNYKNEPFLEISFHTRLVMIGTDNDWAEVQTPHGRKWLKREDVYILTPKPAYPANQERILETAKMFMGVPYIWGGTSCYGFDCSGLMYAIFGVNGFSLPRDADDQARMGLTIEHEKLQPGDLLFFAKGEKKDFIYHVGLYNGNGQMIHASLSSGKIEMIPLENTKYIRELVCRKRILFV